MKKKIKIKDIKCYKNESPICAGCPARLGYIYDEDTKDHCVICKKDFPEYQDQEVEVEE